MKIQPFEEDQIQGASVDIHLGSKILKYKTLNVPYIDVKDVKMEDYIEIIKVDKNGFVLHPGESILAETLETVELSPRIAAKIDGKSSLGRLQIRIQNAGFIDPGFRGNLTLEMKNDGVMAVKLYPLMPIAQLRIFQSDIPCEKPYTGKYQDSIGPVGSRLYLDFKEKEE